MLVRQEGSRGDGMQTGPPPQAGQGGGGGCSRKAFAVAKNACRAFRVVFAATDPSETDALLVPEVGETGCEFSQPHFLIRARISRQCAAVAFPCAPKTPNGGKRHPPCKHCDTNFGAKYGRASQNTSTRPSISQKRAHCHSDDMVSAYHPAPPPPW